MPTAPTSTSDASTKSLKTETSSTSWKIWLPWVIVALLLVYIGVDLASREIVKAHKASSGKVDGVLLWDIQPSARARYDPFTP